MGAQFWKVQFPGGEWGVLEVSEETPNKHEVVGRFPSEARAGAYVEFCSRTALFKSETDARRIAPPGRPRQDANAAVKALTYEAPKTTTNLVRELQGLMAEHPGGISSKLVMEHFNVGYPEACDMLRWADRSGHGKWVYGKDRRRGKLLLPPGVKPDSRELTLAQESLLSTIGKIADANRCVQQSSRDLARESGLKDGSISYILSRLIEKGYLMLARPSHDGRPAVYQLLRPAPTADTDSRRVAN